MNKKIKVIRYTSKFERAYKKLSLEEKIIAEGREKIFRKDPFNSRLKTHKLKGKLKNRWSFSLTYSQRVLFNFYEDSEVIFYDIGNHRIYQ